jgi:hypothetical protein
MDSTRSSEGHVGNTQDITWTRILGIMIKDITMYKLARIFKHSFGWESYLFILVEWNFWEKPLFIVIQE